MWQGKTANANNKESPGTWLNHSTGSPSFFKQLPTSAVTKCIHLKIQTSIAVLDENAQCTVSLKNPQLNPILIQSIHAPLIQDM